MGMTSGGRSRLRPGGDLAKVRGLRRKHQVWRPSTSAVGAQGLEVGEDQGPPVTSLNQEPTPFVPIWKVLQPPGGPGFFTTVASLCFSLK